MDDTHIGVIAVGRPLEDAFRYAQEGQAHWLEENYGMTRRDALRLLGQMLEVRCTAIVNPAYTYIAKVARRFEPMYRRSLKEDPLERFTVLEC